jgi:hypothetical protein
MSSDGEAFRAALLNAEAAIRAAIDRANLANEAERVAIRDLEWAEYVVVCRRKALEGGRSAGRSMASEGRSTAEQSRSVAPRETLAEET